MRPSPRPLRVLVHPDGVRGQLLKVRMQPKRPSSGTPVAFESEIMHRAPPTVLSAVRRGLHIIATFQDFKALLPEFFGCHRFHL